MKRSDVCFLMFVLMFGPVFGQTVSQINPSSMSMDTTFRLANYSPDNFTVILLEIMPTGGFANLTTPVEGANVSVYVFYNGGYHPCENLTTDSSGRVSVNISSCVPEGSVPTIIRFEYHGDDYHRPSLFFYNLPTSSSASRLDQYYGVLLAFLQDPKNMGICFVSIIVFGLLITAMFYTGDDPFGILDITSPKTPRALPKKMYAGKVKAKKFSTRLVGGVMAAVYARKAAKTLGGLLASLKRSDKLSTREKKVLERIERANLDPVTKLYLTKLLLAGDLKEVLAILSREKELPTYEYMLERIRRITLEEEPEELDKATLYTEKYYENLKKAKTYSGHVRMVKKVAEKVDYLPAEGRAPRSLIREVVNTTVSGVAVSAGVALANVILAGPLVVSKMFKGGISLGRLAYSWAKGERRTRFGPFTPLTMHDPLEDVEKMEEEVIGKEVDLNIARLYYLLSLVKEQAEANPDKYGVDYSEVLSKLGQVSAEKDPVVKIRMVHQVMDDVYSKISRHEIEVNESERVFWEHLHRNWSHMYSEVTYKIGGFEEVKDEETGEVRYVRTPYFYDDYHDYARHLAEAYETVHKANDDLWFTYETLDEFKSKGKRKGSVEHALKELLGTSFNEFYTTVKSSVDGQLYVDYSPARETLYDVLREIRETRSQIMSGDESKIEEILGRTDVRVDEKDKNLLVKTVGLTIDRLEKPDQPLLTQLGLGVRDLKRAARLRKKLFQAYTQGMITRITEGIPQEIINLDENDPEISPRYKFYLSYLAVSGGSPPDPHKEIKDAVGKPSKVVKEIVKGWKDERYLEDRLTALQESVEEAIHRLDWSQEVNSRRRDDREVTETIIGRVSSGLKDVVDRIGDDEKRERLVDGVKRVVEDVVGENLLRMTDKGGKEEVLKEVADRLKSDKILTSIVGEVSENRRERNRLLSDIVKVVKKEVRDVDVNKELKISREHVEEEILDQIDRQIIFDLKVLDEYLDLGLREEAHEVMVSENGKLKRKIELDGGLLRDKLHEYEDKFMDDALKGKASITDVHYRALWNLVRDYREDIKKQIPFTVLGIGLGSSDKYTPTPKDLKDLFGNVVHKHMSWWATPDRKLIPAQVVFEGDSKPDGYLITKTLYVVEDKHADHLWQPLNRFETYRIRGFTFTKDQLLSEDRKWKRVRKKLEDLGYLKKDKSGQYYIYSDVNYELFRPVDPGETYVLNGMKIKGKEILRVMERMGSGGGLSDRDRLILRILNDLRKERRVSLKGKLG